LAASRKGQDLVLRAFRVFAQRHPEALLLTAWGSPWPNLARGLPSADDLLLPPLDSAGDVDIAGWTRHNGLYDSQVVHCGALPNRAMARIMWEADVAVFPNRAGSGTNLVAMECMACGVPTILSANTGHLDLLRDDVAYALQHQISIPGGDHAGWGDSDPEEIVAALEEIHRARDVARTRAAPGAAFIASLTWTAQMDQLAKLILPLLPKD
jgi:glycosyltransferase involved in cell wall biosynthesis